MQIRSVGIDRGKMTLTRVPIQPPIVIAWQPEYASRLLTRSIAIG